MAEDSAQPSSVSASGADSISSTAPAVSLVDSSARLEKQLVVDVVSATAAVTDEGEISSTLSTDDVISAKKVHLSAAPD